MSHNVTYYQEESRFGQNTDTLNALQELSEKRPETIQHFENLKNAIDVFNTVEIEIDISIRFKSETFY